MQNNRRCFALQSLIFQKGPVNNRIWLSETLDGMNSMIRRYGGTIWGHCDHTILSNQLG